MLTPIDMDLIFTKLTGSRMQLTMKSTNFDDKIKSPTLGITPN